MLNDAADDLDGDGLDNLSEFEYYTNPELSDSDSDGLLDGEEVHTYFTNPKDFDSDDDGLHDGEEVSIYFTDPSDYDSDDDNLNDGAEVNTYNTDPLDPETHPLAADIRNQIIGGSVFGVLVIGSFTVYILIKKRIIKIKK